MCFSNYLNFLIMIKWNLIINTIKAEKCILFLGPEAFSPDGNKTYHAALCEYLHAHTKGVMPYYDKDEFFYFADKQTKLETYYDILEFYNQKFTTETYDKVAQLPFPVVVSLNPDDFLHKAMERLGFEHQFEFFHKLKDFNKITPPVKANPLIYNLFGHYNEAESLILTHNDLFDFVFLLLGSKGLPNELRTKLNEADNFIFVGCRFDKWYLQVLLRLINPKGEKIQLALDKLLIPESRGFFMDQFNVQFVDETPADFINQLHAKCAEAGILRRTDDTDIPVWQKVQNAVSADNIESALKMMEDYAKANVPDIVSDIVLIQSQHSRLNRQIAKQVIDQKEANLEINKIKDSILQLNKEIR